MSNLEDGKITNLLFITKMYSSYSSVFVWVCEDNPAKLKQLRPCWHVCVFTYTRVSVCMFIYASVQ